ncbi:MAG: hypothetical protein MZV49_19625 [Rhodopseudomonas palustris]|nr:hypothetical protein [Rhodopseudomonas palustris]
MSRFFVLLGLAAFPASAQTLEPPNLQIVPRTAAESERIAGVLARPGDFGTPEAFEALPGGAASVRARDTADAFSQSSGNMPYDREMDFKLGNGLFRKLWVASPSSTQASDGLGPLYNARGCQNCHIKDGRGHVPEAPGAEAVSMFLRLSVPGGPSPRRHRGLDRHAAPIRPMAASFRTSPPPAMRPRAGCGSTGRRCR